MVLPMVEERVRACREKAKAALGATVAQVEHGLELHRDSFVCDCFAFSPGLCSRTEIEHVNQVIDEGGSDVEVEEAREDTRTVSPVMVPELREAYRAILDAAGVDCLVSTVGVGPRMRRGSAQCGSVHVPVRWHGRHPQQGRDRGRGPA